MDALYRMLRIGLVAAVVAGAFALAMPAAMGESVSCGERHGILEWLEGKFYEKRTAFGLTSDGRVLEVFAAPSGSWTILVTYPGGLSCLVTSGIDWQQIERRQEDTVS